MRFSIPKFLWSLLLFGWLSLGLVAPAIAAPEATTPTPAPTQDTAIDLLADLNELYEKAMQATEQGNFKAAEGYWTDMLDRFPYNPAVWSNRGNAKLSQDKAESALQDYAKAIELAPEATDPYLNRGAAYERLGKWEDAIADYNHVIELDPKDAMAYNNRGNATASLGNWEDAIADYKKAADLAPNFAFARANYALALYETGKTDTAIRTMRNILRKYPSFPDVRAALTAALWASGKQGEAESEWVSVAASDARYKDLTWLKDIRRWPPSMITAMSQFLNLQTSPADSTQPAEVANPPA